MKRHATVLVFAASAVLLTAAAPEHYKNDPKNINPDPNYVPGPYVLPDTFEAKTAFEAKKAELSKLDEIADSKKLITVGGEVTAVAIKNESARVQGYFRNFYGVAKLGPKSVESVDLLLDVNSFDTAVPGRNNRILDIFFNATKGELGTASVHFDKIDLKGKSLKDLLAGKVKIISASGTLSLNGKQAAVSADLKVEKKGSTFTVETEKPIMVSIADFDLADRALALMKECNHKAIGNAVEVAVKLAFR